jgi:Arc/MetJ-type ribon-helix-helix transcriptional regulator
VRTITLRVPDADLAEIDAAAGSGNRTQFVLAAVRESIQRRHRERLDAEVARILALDADENLAMVAEFDHAMADGLD